MPCQDTDFKKKIVLAQICGSEPLRTKYLVVHLSFFSQEHLFYFTNSVFMSTEFCLGIFTSQSLPKIKVREFFFHDLLCYGNLKLIPILSNSFGVT